MTILDEALRRALDDSVATSALMACTLAGQAELSTSGKLAVASLCICLEHREASLLLVAHGARTSALTMMRPIFEACVRGCWLGYVANDQQINGVLADTLSTNLQSMANAVGRTEPALRAITSIAAIYKQCLDDFVHGTGGQLARWWGMTDIRPHHTSDEMIELLRFVDSVGLIACVAREKLCGRPSEPFLLRLHETYGT